MFRTSIKSAFMAVFLMAGAGIVGANMYEYGSAIPFWLAPFVLAGFMALAMGSFYNLFRFIAEVETACPWLFNRNHKWLWDTKDRAWTRSIQVNDGLVIACVVRTPLLVGADTNMKPYFGALWHHCGGELFPLDDKEFASLKEAKAWCDRQLLVA